MRNSIRTRLIVTFIALAVIPLIVVISIAIPQTLNTETQQALVVQDTLASRESGQVDAFFQDLENQLQIISRQGDLLTVTPAQQQIVLSGLLVHQNAFERIFLLNSQGQEQAGVSRSFAIASSDLVSRAQADEYKVPISSNQIYYSSVHVDETTGESLITVGIPIEDFSTGKANAVLVADLRFVVVQDIIGNTEPSDLLRGNQNNIYMLDSTNRVVAHSDPSVSLRDLRFIPVGKSGVQNGLRGISSVLATSEIQLGDQTFTVVAETPVSQALASVYNTGILSVVLTGVVLAIAVIIAVLLANEIIKPILSLAVTAQGIQAGNFSQRANANRKDEIGQLARAFNSMTDQLQQSLKGLQDHVQDLENARVEREKLIKDLQAAKRLAEENSRLKSEFLSTMSHELRTPLNAIEGFTGIILNRIGGTDFNAKAEGYLVRIRSNSKRLLQLINDFLDLSRVEAGRLELANQPFSPIHLAKRWQDEIGILAEKKGVQFVISLDPTLPETVYGDEEAISKVILNLLGNAIKFTEHGQVALTVDRTDSLWGITVEDSGIGIPPHAREFIFEEFRQVDQTSKRKYGGTGLGLAIVQKYTRAMGGTVQVKSELGKGSTFSVSLPLKTTA
ncbi:MAG: ATP-binding protein [Chloroflexota bacterium]